MNYPTCGSFPNHLKVGFPVFCVSLMVLLLIVPVSAEQTQWSKTYADSHGAGNCLIATVDGCFLIAGSSNRHFMLAKADSNGELMWARTYQTGEATCLIQTSDGGYALAGMGDVNFIKTDSLGIMQWSKNYTNTYLDMTFKVNSVIQTSDEGYVLAGYVPAGNAPQFDWTIKTSKNGTIIWSQTYGTLVAQSFAQDVVAVDDGYVLAANRKLYGLNMNGEVVWSEPCVTAGSLIKTSDSGYLLASSDGAALTKTDAQGKTEWSKPYQFGSRYSFFQDVIQTIDGGYIACGQAYPEYEGVAWIVKVDSNGDQQYLKFAERFMGHNSKAKSIIEVSENVYVFTGSISSIIDTSYSDVLLAKVVDSIESAENSDFSGSPNTAATPTPSIPEFSFYTLLPLFAIFFVILLFRRKTIHLKHL